jgi:single-strand DNA-binding protein
MAYSSINRVVLIGRLTHDPELRALPSGTTVCSLRVACNTSRKTDDGGYSDRPNYFNVSAFGGRGESVSRYMRKGRRIAIDGHLEWREWETAEGSRRQAVEIVAENVQFLDGPAEHSRDDGALDDGSDGESSAAGDSDAPGGDERELAGVGASSEDALVF